MKPNDQKQFFSVFQFISFILRVEKPLLFLSFLSCLPQFKIGADKLRFFEFSLDPFAAGYCSFVEQGKFPT